MANYGAFHAPGGGAVAASASGVPPTSDLLPAAMLLVPDSDLSERLVRWQNAAFHVGHRAFLVLILGCLTLLSPFIGFAAALYAYGFALLRRIAYILGKLFADRAGLGDLLRTAALYLAHKRKALRMAGGAVQLPAAGYRTAPRSAAVMLEELRTPGEGGAAVAAAEPLWERVAGFYNRGFALGFMAGSVFVTAVTLVVAPFVAVFYAGADAFVVIFRPFNRSEGRVLTDLVGVSELVDQGTALMLEEMGLRSPFPATLQGEGDVDARDAGGSEGAAAPGAGTPAAAAAQPLVRDMAPV